MRLGGGGQKEKIQRIKINTKGKKIQITYLLSTLIEYFIIINFITFS